jgi:hypothetical protein
MLIKSPNATDKHVGARVRMRRLMLGMSQTNLGDGLGLTFHKFRNMKRARTASVRVACSKFLTFYRWRSRSSSKDCQTCQVIPAKTPHRRRHPMSLITSRLPTGYPSRNHSWQSTIRSSGVASSVWSKKLLPVTADTAVRPRHLLATPQSSCRSRDAFQSPRRGLRAACACRFRSRPQSRASDVALGEKLPPNTAIRTIQPKPGQGAD